MKKRILKLNREVLRNLTQPDATNAQGGVIGTTLRASGISCACTATVGTGLTCGVCNERTQLTCVGQCL